MDQVRCFFGNSLFAQIQRIDKEQYALLVVANERTMIDADGLRLEPLKAIVTAIALNETWMELLPTIDRWEAKDRGQPNLYDRLLEEWMDT